MIAAVLQIMPHRHRNIVFALAVFCWVTFFSGLASAAPSWKNLGTVTTLTNNQMCYTDGTNIVCDSNAPTLSGGSVGIGTTSPQAMLDMNAGDASPQLNITNTSSSTQRWPGIILKDYTGGNGGYGALAFETSRGSAASPVAIVSSDVLGGFSAWGQYDGNLGDYGQGAAIFFPAEGNFSSTSFPAAIKFSTTAIGTTALTERMRITNSGSVGIGTTSPATKLDIQAARTGANTLLNLGVTGTGVVGDSVGLTFSSPGTGGTVRVNAGISGIMGQTNTLGSLAFSTARLAGVLTEAMRIDDLGNVGIGTTSPSTALQVVGTVTDTGETVTGNATISGSVGIGTTTPVALVNLYKSTPIFELDNSGATTSKDDIHLVTLSDGNMLGTATNLGWEIDARSNAYTTIPTQQNDLQFFYWDGTAFNPRLYISHAGKIGIGTTTPNSKLQIYQGEVQVGSSGASCSATVAGALRYSGGSAYVCDGTNWDVIGGSSGGTLPSLSNGDIWVGNASNVATAVALSQDVTITNAGVATVGKIQNVTVGSPTGTAGSAVVLAASPTLTGTVSAANVTMSGKESLTLGSDYTTTGSQADVNLGAVSAVRYNGAGAATFQGLVAGTGGQILYLHNPSAYTLTLADQSDSTDATAANKIITGTAADLPIPTNTSVSLQYDSASSRWRVTGSSNSAKALAAGSDTQVQFNNSGNMAGDANFTWDYTNHRLGIGTTSPVYPLDVFGDLRVQAATPVNTNIWMPNGAGTQIWALTSNTGGSFTIWDQTNLTARLAIKGSNVGIGTTTPKSLLDVSSASFGTYAGVTAAPANDLIVGGSVGIGTATPNGTSSLEVYTSSSAASGATYGVLVTGPQTVADTGTYYGIYANPSYTAVTGNTLAALNGLYDNPINSSTGTVTTLRGTYDLPQNTGGGTVTNMYGLLTLPQTTGTSTTTTTYGIYNNPQLTGSGALTTVYGEYVDPYATAASSGSITNEYGIFVRGGNASTSGAVVTNYYQMYLATPLVAGSISGNLYGVYQAYASENNYFAGKVGIGSTSPAAPLDLGGVLLFNEGGGNVAVGPDIYMNVSGLIAADDHLYLNIDSDNSGTGDLLIGKGATTSAATNLMIVKNSGSVGIGTTSPATGMKVDINGPVKVAGTGSEACTASTVGAMRYNSTGHYMEICQ